MQKSRGVHRFEPNLAIKSEGNLLTPQNTPQIVHQMTKEERKVALAKFILSRRILLEKNKENKHKSYREVYLTEELKDEDILNEDFVVEDYIKEDFEDN